MKKINIDILADALSRISDELIAEAENTSVFRKHIKLSKVIAVSAAAAMILGITAAAVVILGGREGHSYNIPTYTAVPAPPELENDTGMDVEIIPAFSNGFTFNAGYISDNTDSDLDGNIVEEYKGLSFDYTDGENTVYLSIDPSAAGIQLKDPESAGTFDGISLMYYSYQNKLVPPDYKMGEQDKLDEASGKYVFSYGNPEIEIRAVQGLAWEQDGLNFELLAIDTNLTKDDLAAMARELISLQN